MVNEFSVQLEIENSEVSELELLKKFNNKISIAFGGVYSMFYRELNIYAASLYRGTDVMSEDVVHDIFIHIWTSNIRFETLSGIKAYVYVSIKNGFRNYLERNQSAEKYKNQVDPNDEFVIDMVECEIYSIVEEALNVLPKSYAEVMRLYLEGWKSGEIAEKLQKTEQNVYNIKNKSIHLLRGKIDKDKLLIITILLKLT